MATLSTPSAEAPESEKAHAGLTEPSMEDILASIRRIIAEDQSNSLGRSGLGGLTRRAAAAAAAPVVEAPPAPVNDGPAAIAPSADLVSDDRVPAEDHGAEHQDSPEQPYAELQDIHHEESPVQPEPPTYAAVQPANDVAPVSPTSRSAPTTHDTFVAAELAPPAQEHWVDDAPLISRSAGDSITSSFHALAETVLLQDPDMVERVTRDVLRPMLKSWLDDNLPSIVERLVRVEIERVARGGRSRD